MNLHQPTENQAIKILDTSMGQVMLQDRMAVEHRLEVMG